MQIIKKKLLLQNNIIMYIPMYTIYNIFCVFNGHKNCLCLYTFTYIHKKQFIHIFTSHSKYENWFTRTSI